MTIWFVRGKHTDENRIIFAAVKRGVTQSDGLRAGNAAGQTVTSSDSPNA
jgi:hypothetical protein